MRTLLYLLLLVVACFSCGVEPTVTCADDSACFDGYRCDEVTATCRRACEAQSDCLASQFCDIPTGESVGVCRLDDGGQSSNNNN